MALVIELPRTIDGSLAADIEKESAFVSPYLTGLRVAPEGNAVELSQGLATLGTSLRA